jgi:hypothetical protein
MGGVSSILGNKQKEVDALTKELEATENKNKELNNKIESLNRNVNSTLIKDNVDANKLADCKQGTKTLYHEIKKSQNSEVQLKAKLAKITKELGTVNQKNVRLRNSLAVNSSNNSGATEKLVGTYENQIKLLKSKNEELQTKYKNHVSGVDEKRSSIEKHHTQSLNVMKEQNDQKLKELKERHKTEISNNRNNVNRGQAIQINELKKEHRNQIESLANRVGDQRKIHSEKHKEEIRSLKNALDKGVFKFDAERKELVKEKNWWKLRTNHLVKHDADRKVELRNCKEQVANFKYETTNAEKSYRKLKTEYDIMAKYVDFTVKKETVTIPFPVDKPVTIRIRHVDVHPEGFASISFIRNGNNETFKFKGNGGLIFINGTAETGRMGVGKGNHGGALKEFYGFKNDYVITCETVTGVNTWVFQTAPGVSSIKLTEKSNWGGLKNVSVKF